MRACAKGGGTVAPIVRDYALPIAQAQVAHAQVAHAAGRTSRRGR